MNTNQNTNRIAVFIDADNLVYGLTETATTLKLRPIMDRIREEGQIVSTRAYGDWSRGYSYEFRDNLVEMIQLSTSSHGKNTADIQLALDALEMALLPVSPDTVVVISGDRDFVPLIQKIRRYGKSVIGIGSSEDSSADLLIDACDLFLFAEDILNAATTSVPEKPTQTTQTAVTGEIEEPDAVTVDSEIVVPANRKVRRAFTLLARAISACERQGQLATESAVNLRMRQISSTFYPHRYGFASFQEFARAAAKANYAKIARDCGPDGIVFDSSHRIAPELLQDESSDYDFSTTEAALESYREILREHKRVELLPWSDRKQLVTKAWKTLSEGPKLFDDLIYTLKTYARTEMHWVEPHAVEIVVRTLSITKCFDSDDGVPEFNNPHCHVYPKNGVDVTEAFFLMNLTYLRGIRMSVPNAVFDVDAVSELLFDKVSDGFRKASKRLVEAMGVVPRSNETSLGQAFKRAGVEVDDADTSETTEDN